MKFITWVLVVLSTFLSTYLTISFGMSLGLSSSAFTVVCIGLVWEIAKYTFTHQGAVLIRRMNLRDCVTGGIYLGLAAVLIAGSICASIAAAESIRAQEERLLAEELSRVTGVQQKVGLVATLTASANNDIANGYRARGNTTLAKAMALQDEIDNASKMATSALPVVGDTAWWVAICVVAFMLDFIGVAGMHMLTSQNLVPPIPRPKKMPNNSENNDVRSNRAQFDDNRDVRGLTTHSVEEIAKRVARKEIHPGYAALARVGVSQKTAKKVLDMCVKDGAIRYTNRKFEYT